MHADKCKLAGAADAFQAVTSALAAINAARSGPSAADAALAPPGGSAASRPAAPPQPPSRFSLPALAAACCVDSRQRVVLPALEVGPAQFAALLPPGVALPPPLLPNEPTPYLLAFVQDSDPRWLRRVAAGGGAKRPAAAARPAAAGAAVAEAGDGTDESMADALPPPTIAAPGDGCDGALDGGSQRAAEATADAAPAEPVTPTKPAGGAPAAAVASPTTPPGAPPPPPLNGRYRQMFAQVAIELPPTCGPARLAHLQAALTALRAVLLAPAYSCLSGGFPLNGARTRRISLSLCSAPAASLCCRRREYQTPSSPLPPISAPRLPRHPGSPPKQQAPTSRPTRSSWTPASPPHPCR